MGVKTKQEDFWGMKTNHPTVLSILKAKRLGVWQDHLWKWAISRHSLILGGFWTPLSRLLSSSSPGIFQEKQRAAQSCGGRNKGTHLRTSKQTSGTNHRCCSDAELECAYKVISSIFVPMLQDIF